MCKIHHNYFKKQVVVQVVVLYVIYNISMVKYIEAMTMISIIYAKWLWLVKISGCGLALSASTANFLIMSYYREEG